MMNSIVADCEFLLLALGLTLAFAYYLGKYIAHLIKGTPRPLERYLARIEGFTFRICGIDADQPMGWKEYTVSLLVLDLVFAVFAYVLLGLQGVLPGNPGALGPPSWDLNLNTASSFITNTNLQHYAPSPFTAQGGAIFTVFSQLTLMLLQFVAPASAIAVGFAFLRPFVRKGSNLGNFYADFVRATLTILLPIAFLAALFLMAENVPQTLAGSWTTGLIGGGSQTLVVGPLAGQTAIMELGQNGGGYFGSNLGNTLADPNGVTNLIYIFLMLVIPLAFVFAYGECLGRKRGRALMVAIMAPFLALLAYGLSATTGTYGLETRFGTFGSMLFQYASISTDSGATIGSLAGFNARSVASMFTFMFVQAIPGGSGVGFMTLLVYVFLTIFMVGLMVGKTPEFIGMKITGRDVKLAVLTFIIHPLAILVPTCIAYLTGNVTAILGPNSGASGFTQVFYEYTSASANNGSDYLGALANTPFWNVSTAIVMIIGRYAPVIFMMAIAGSFGEKDRRNTPEPIRTDGWPFTVTLIGVTFVLTALAFLPFLIIGVFG